MKERRMSRRSLLKGLAAGGAAAAAAMALKPGYAPASALVETETLYHETESIRKYYASLKN